MNTLIIACFLVAGLLPVIASSADDDDDKPTKPKNAEVTGVVLPGTAQSKAGIETQEIQAAHHHLELLTYGKAINIQPLLALRHRYLLALSEGNGTKARLTQSEQSINRAQILYNQGVTAKRQLQEQQAQWQSNQAQANASQLQAQAIIDEARLDWGSTLTDWALSADAKPLNAFLTGKQVLLQISLPVGKQLADGVTDIAVDSSGKRPQATSAKLISSAPQIDSTVQGASYFFASTDPHLKPGMRVSAWVTEQQDAISGVNVPKSALLWYLDQAFVYVKNAAGKFSKRVISGYTATPEGYFISEGLEAGEQVVVVGGQLLLSEELRGQLQDDD
jgi:multidrug efflux pump subunit AcrA (membrane-fusion protein)